MKIFVNPLAVAVYTAALLAIGWTIGAHYKNTVASAWMVFFAMIFLLLHDAAIAILLVIAATKVAPSGR
jgi:hypothetical protein